MLVFDYVEIREDLFEHLLSGGLPYKVHRVDGVIKSTYKRFEHDIIEVYDISSNSYQYFIDSAHPV